MEGLLAIILLLGTLVSTISKADKRRKTQRDISGRSGRPGSPEYMAKEAPRQKTAPVAPVRIDLPGQRTLPTTSPSVTEPLQTRLRTAWEGEDPCHDDLYTSPEGRPSYTPGVPVWPYAPDGTGAVNATQPQGNVGLHLSFGEDSMVRGVIYAEILNRRPAGRRR